MSGRATEDAMQQEIDRLKERIEELEGDQLATGDMLSALLGTTRCEDGNICHANDLALILHKTVPVHTELAGRAKALAQEFRDGAAEKNAIYAVCFTKDVAPLIAEFLDALALENSALRVRDSNVTMHSLNVMAVNEDLQAKIERLRKIVEDEPVEHIAFDLMLDELGGLGAFGGTK